MFPQQLTLRHGQTLTLRQALPADAPETLAYVNRVSGESDFLTFGLGEFKMTVEEEEEFIQKCYEAETALMLLAQVGGQIVGLLTFEGNVRQRVAHCGEMGITVRQDFWGQGIGKQLLLALLAWAKAGGIIRKINLRVRRDNERGIRLYRQLGFSEEGRLSRDMCIKGQFYDSLLMGIAID